MKSAPANTQTAASTRSALVAKSRTDSLIVSFVRSAAMISRCSSDWITFFIANRPGPMGNQVAAGHTFITATRETSAGAHASGFGIPSSTRRVPRMASAA
jgi:hypothetical protein